MVLLKRLNPHNTYKILKVLKSNLQYDILESGTKENKKMTCNQVNNDIY